MLSRPSPCPASAIAHVYIWPPTCASCRKHPADLPVDSTDCLDEDVKMSMCRQGVRIRCCCARCDCTRRLALSRQRASTHQHLPGQGEVRALSSPACCSDCRLDSFRRPYSAGEGPRKGWWPASAAVSEQLDAPEGGGPPPDEVLIVVQVCSWSSTRIRLVSLQALPEAPLGSMCEHHATWQRNSVMPVTGRPEQVCGQMHASHSVCACFS